MKKSRFSEAQIVGILKEVELGAKVGDTAANTASATLRITSGRACTPGCPCLNRPEFCR